VGRLAPAAGVRAHHRAPDHRRREHLRALRRAAARTAARAAAHQRRRRRNRRRGLDRPLAQRQRRLLLPVRGDVERHALPVLVGEHRLRADLGVGRQRARGRFHGHDAHPAARPARQRRGQLEGAARAGRALDRRAPDLELRTGPDQRRRRDLRRRAQRPGERRRPPAPARRALRPGRGGLVVRGPDHLAHGRRLLVPGDRDVVGLRHDPPRRLERRDRPADDLPDRLPALVQRGPAVLHPGRELLRELRLRRVPVRRGSSTPRPSRPRATATRSRASRAASRSRASTRWAIAATTPPPR
jgi:hypothetical protein